jgi:hypothetical protein
MEEDSRIQVSVTKPEENIPLGRHTSNGRIILKWNLEKETYSDFVL